MKLPHLLSSFVVGSLLLISSPSQAMLLTYDVDPVSSGAVGAVDMNISIDVTNYLGLGFPLTLGRVDLTDKQAFDLPFSGSVVLDSGLPAALNLAPDGLLLNALDLVAVAASPTTPLVVLSGSGNFDPSGAPADFVSNIWAFSLVADQAVSTTLRPTGVAGEYAWGPVDVDATITFDMDTTITVNGVEFFDSGLIVDSITILGLTGTYSGDDLGTILAASFALPDIVYAPPMEEPEPGIKYWVDVTATIPQLDVVALNDTPMPVPEPSIFVLQGVAFLGLGLLRSRRRKPGA